MVSIIIPVYNTGKVLEKCLQSVLFQTYKDWECVIVNDCSTDRRTLQCLSKWKERDERFLLIDNDTNLGIEKTRFVGLSAVSGEYVMFMDHDDWLYDKFSLQCLVENAEKTNADVVIGNHVNAYGFIERSSVLSVPVGIIYQPELKNKYYCSYFGVNIMPVLVWARLYSKKLIDKAKMRPRGLRYADDVAWNLFIMPFAESVSIISDKVYVHRWGGLSSTCSRALEEYKHFYWVRREAIVRFDFPEARRWLDVEMKNILFEHLRQQMVMLGQSEEKIMHDLKIELQNPIWKEIALSLAACSHDAFTRAFLVGDAAMMIRLVRVHIHSPKERLKRWLKTILRVFV